MAENLDNQNKDLYTKLIRYPNRFWVLIALMIIVALIIMSLVFSMMVFKEEWATLVIPVAMVSTILVIYPRTEEWEYKPWQSEAEKREQTFFD